MRRVRKESTAHQQAAVATPPLPMPLDDGTVTLAMIQALIPLGLRAVEEALQQEVTALAGARYAHHDGAPGVVRWGQQAGSIYLADQKLPITVPRVRDQQAGCEVPLATYATLQTPRARCRAVSTRPRWHLVSRVRSRCRGRARRVRLGQIDGVTPLCARECARVAATARPPARDAT